MAKPAKYPKKLRQTLEKIVATRNEQAAKLLEEFDPFKTFWSDFLENSRVHLMHTKLDEDRGRMSSHMYLQPNFFSRMEEVFVEPPWLSNGSASE